LTTRGFWVSFSVDEEKRSTHCLKTKTRDYSFF
jgi:hypothetical protein